MPSRPISFLLAPLGLACAAPALLAAPVETAFPAAGPDDCVAVSAPAFTGRRAIADSYEDSVEIRDFHGNLVHTITREEIDALAPWFDLTGNQDGPCALAWSDSGRHLYILAFDSTSPGDGQGSDVILRYDAYDNTLIRFARLELSSNENAFPHLGAAHFAGRLYVGSDTGVVTAYNASSTASSGTVRWTGTVPGGTGIRGVTIDRIGRWLYLANAGTIYRHDLDINSLNITAVGSIPDITALSYSAHYGAPGQEGLFILHTPVVGGSTISRISDNQALGLAPFAPVVYTTTAATWHDLSRTADGRLIVGADEDGSIIFDSSDTRLSFTDWIADEFAQVVDFGKGLISPDGEPHGWVIDADVIPEWNRFHPATPDGAAWVVFLLLMNDHLYADPEAQTLVRDILERYAGLKPDGIGASRSADGFFRHWIDPVNGQTKPGWSNELATYSTMKLVAAADRAASYYPDDDAIQEAAKEIICGVTNWDGFIQPAGTRAVYLIAAPGGGVSGTANNPPFTEGVIYVEQAATYGGESSGTALTKWMDRSQSPSAQTLTGRPVTTNSGGSFLPTFITIYSELLQPAFRANATWDAHTENMLVSQAAWTDDNGPEFYTVFSAGTTKGEWGGYNADSLTSHPGNVTTFTSLMGFGAMGWIDPAVAAYQAYRNGARQTFKCGASILYRRSATDPLYDPNSAGLPDVALGALGLAELIAPGSIDSVLAIPYDADICAVPPACVGDLTGDGRVNVSDFNVLAAFFNTGPGATPAYGDLTGDGYINVSDFNILAGNFGCVNP